MLWVGVGLGDRVFGYLCRKHRRTPTPCSWNPRPQGLQHLRNLQTPAASGRAQVRKPWASLRGKPLRIPREGSQLQTRVSRLENPAGIVGRYPRRLDSEIVRKTRNGSRVWHGMGSEVDEWEQAQE